MNKEQIEKLKELLLSLGFTIQETEQRITKFNNDSHSGEVSITYQFKFKYEIS